LAGEEEELRDDQVRDVVVDRCAEEDDVVAQQTAVDVIGAFAPARLLEHHRYKSHSSSSLFLGNAGSEYSHGLRMCGVEAGWTTHLRVAHDREGGMRDQIRMRASRREPRRSSRGEAARECGSATHPR